MPAKRESWAKAGREGPVPRGPEHGRRAKFDPGTVLHGGGVEHPPQPAGLPPLELSEFAGCQFPCRYIDQAQNRQGDAIIRFMVDRRYVHLAVPPLLKSQGVAMHADFQRWKLAERSRDAEEV